MKKPLWAEIISLMALVSIFAFIVGCEMNETPDSPPPKPSVTVTIQETSEKFVEVQVFYDNQDHGNGHIGWSRVTFKTEEDARHYREQLEFAVVKLKESEEKMKNVGMVKTEKEAR